jgi:hypothetical protein
MTLALVLLVVTKENGFFRLAKIFETWFIFHKLVLQLEIKIVLKMVAHHPFKFEFMAPIYNFGTVFIFSITILTFFFFFFLVHVAFPL